MDRATDRRQFVQVLSGGLAIGLDGCLGGDEDETEENGENSENGTDTEGSAGLSYAFDPETIGLIDPGEGEVVDEITDGVEGYAHGDAVVTNDGSQLFVIETSASQVLVIHIETREITAEVPMGPAGTHMYHPNDEEMWAHSDAEGTFYVIDTTDHEVVETVEAGLGAEGHGKLLYHEDFGSTGYATNVNDPAAHVIDMDAYERIDSIELGDEGGTHYKGYSPQASLAYFERSGGVGTTAVVDIESNEVVDELDLAGGMYLTPDEQLLGNIGEEEIRFLDATSEDSDEVGTVGVEGGPDALEYYEADGTLYGFTANTMSPDATVVDVDELEVVDRIDAGEIERPENTHSLHRSGVSGDGYFFTPASADGTVAVIDMADRELIEYVPVEDDVDTVQYVPE
ncbi:YncE family protein [Natrinema versiforme]|uniref:Cell surface protein n=1 Tax=Natrinema versiforme TaxID=88724 RepID=A0A4P8WLK9_9EURY|nr:hypothetical protein [Natrinema versiforme]QCS44467.1 hypothetical protein FEJ81_19210 [Natrinema versiforme]